jgi:membrane-associated protein
MNGLSGVLAAVPPWLLLLLVFLLPALEASTLLGVVVPGETAVLLGGVFAHEGRLPLAAVMIAAVFGGVVGDNIGYLLGARLGPRLLTRGSGRAEARLRRARSFVQRFGRAAVLLGRWVAVLRALVPSVAGAGGLPYRSFAVYNWPAAPSGASRSPLSVISPRQRTGWPPVISGLPGRRWFCCSRLSPSPGRSGRAGVDALFDREQTFLNRRICRARRFQLAGSGVGRLPGRPGHAGARS